MINPFDNVTMHYLNQLPAKYESLNQTMGLLLENELLQGGVMMSFFWWVWFRKSDRKIKDQEYVISGIGAATGVVLVARLMAHLLPFRERPLFNPELHFVLPQEYMKYHLIYWSSFPSDHAVLYFCLATSVFLASRRLGVLAYCHALLIVCLPRVYFGIHFPTDILAGALLGIGAANLFGSDRIRAFFTRLPLQWLETSPNLFFPNFFLATFVIATDFEPLRTVAVFSLRMTKALSHTTGLISH